MGAYNGRSSGRLKYAGSGGERAAGGMARVKIKIARKNLRPVGREGVGGLGGYRSSRLLACNLKASRWFFAGPAKALGAYE